MITLDWICFGFQIRIHAKFWESLKRHVLSTYAYSYRSCFDVKIRWFSIMHVICFKQYDIFNVIVVINWKEHIFTSNISEIKVYFISGLFSLDFQSFLGGFFFCIFGDYCFILVLGWLFWFFFVWFVRYVFMNSTILWRIISENQDLKLQVCLFKGLWVYYVAYICF